MNTNTADVLQFIEKWQKLLRLQDWDIKYLSITKEWRKTGDIKVDVDDRTAILLLNICNPKQTNLEQVIIHELLHLKLWEMDQITEKLINTAFDGSMEPCRKIVFSQYMGVLEYTVNDLSKAFLTLAGNDKEISFGRLECALNEELGSLL